MLAAYTKSEKQSNAFTLMGANSLLTSSRDAKSETGVSILSSSADSFDTCTFANIFSEPSYGELMTFAENYETCGSVAYSNDETCGSIAYSGGETCGSVATSGGCSSGGFSGCSYSC